MLHNCSSNSKHCGNILHKTARIREYNRTWLLKQFHNISILFIIKFNFIHLDALDSVVLDDIKCFIQMMKKTILIRFCVFSRLVCVCELMLCHSNWIYYLIMTLVFGLTTVFCWVFYSFLNAYCSCNCAQYDYIVHLRIHITVWIGGIWAWNLPVANLVVRHIWNLQKVSGYTQNRIFICIYSFFILHKLGIFGKCMKI